jgi:hypothetical protein
MRAYRYTHREFVLGPAPGEFATRGYATPCCQEVVRGLMKGDYRHVGQCAFRAARESDIMVTLLHNTIGVLRSIARQKEGPRHHPPGPRPCPAHAEGAQSRGDAVRSRLGAAAHLR